MADKPIGKDVSGQTILVEAVRELLNRYPGLQEGQKIRFEELGKDGGIAFSADNGALVMSEKEDICGNMHQVCQFPFYVVYRTAAQRERQKLNVQSFLDHLGQWICGEPVNINGTQMQLRTFPQLPGGRTIKRIMRENSYGLEPQENGVQDWLLPVTVRYKYDWERW